MKQHNVFRLNLSFEDVTPTFEHTIPYSWPLGSHLSFQVHCRNGVVANLEPVKESTVNPDAWLMRVDGQASKYHGEIFEVIKDASKDIIPDGPVPAGFTKQMTTTFVHVPKAGRLRAL